MRNRENVSIAMHLSSISLILFWLLGWIPLLFLPVLAFAYAIWKGVISRD
jgi:hypothetical protein